MTEETVNDEELHRQAGDAALLLEKQIEHRIARAMVNLFAPGNTRLQEKLEEAIAENDLLDMADVVAEAFNKRCKKQAEIERNDTLVDQMRQRYIPTQSSSSFGDTVGGAITSSGTLTVPNDSAISGSLLDAIKGLVGITPTQTAGGSDNGNSC